MVGQCFGAESLPMSAPSPCSAAALTASRALYLCPDDVRALTAAHPEFLQLLLELVSSRLKQFVTLVHDLAFRDVAARLAAVLMTRALEEGRQTEQGICIDRLLTQQEFAALIGTAREVIYRTFRRFEQENLITLTPHDIFILDLDRLAQLASQETR
jgi:CRP/FNR family transcriptional regulator